MNIILLLHGYNGCKEDLTLFKLKYEKMNYMILSESYKEKKIQLWGARVVKDVINFFETLVNNRSILQDKSELLTINFSMLGHSLGGVIARYVLPDLLEYWHKNRNNFTVRLRQFITIGTPHLGIRRVGGNLPKNLWKNAVAWFSISKLGGEIPAQLHYEAEQLEDRDIQNPKLPNVLLLQMCFGKFYDALLKFETRTLVAVTHFDFSVPFPSASIRQYNPYSPIGPEGFEGFKLLSVLAPEDFPKEIITSNEEWIGDNYNHLNIHNQSLQQLQSIPWRRVDTQFYFGNMKRLSNVLHYHTMIVGKVSKFVPFVNDNTHQAMNDSVDTIFNNIIDFS